MCLIALLTLGLAFTTACGSDDPEDNNKPANNSSNDKDTGGNGDKDTSGGNEDKDTSGGTGDKDTSGGGEVTPPAPTACESANPPARCSAEIAGFEFGTASVITEFKIASGDDDCCFDFNDNDENDNALGEALSIINLLDLTNDAIAETIEDGTFTIILEHDGLENLEGDDFTINFFLGQYDNGDLLIDPASIDQGTQPLAFLPDAKLANDKTLTAGPGSVMISLELFGTKLDLSIRDAKISTDVDEANSSIEDGITLTEGKLGGLIVVQEVYDAVNNVAETCECLGLGGAKLIDNNACYSSTVDGKKVGIDQTHNCDEETDVACHTLATSCGAVIGAAIFVDQDYGNTGTDNALSLGATFKAEAAKITGVANE